jgi:hypothetical protein
VIRRIQTEEIVKLVFPKTILVPLALDQEKLRFASSCLIRMGHHQLRAELPQFPEIFLIMHADVVNLAIFPDHRWPARIEGDEFILDHCS